jgi:hypothetical protein
VFGLPTETTASVHKWLAILWVGIKHGVWRTAAVLDRLFDASALTGDWAVAQELSYSP